MQIGQICIILESIEKASKMEDILFYVKLRKVITGVFRIVCLLHFSKCLNGLPKSFLQAVLAVKPEQGE